MALFAIRPEIEIVRILVAAVAIAERHSGELLEGLSAAGLFFVAFDAIHRSVLAHKGKIRLAVIKFCRRSKGGCRMAFRTIGAQGFLVVVFMAGIALAAQAQVGLAPFFQFPVLHKVRFMALAAIGCPVRTGKIEARQAVVEFVFIETNDVKIPAVVVTVADGTIFSFGFV